MKNIPRIIGERLEELLAKAKIKPIDCDRADWTMDASLSIGSIVKIVEVLELSLKELFANIILSDKKNNKIALSCYHLILEQETDRQKDILGSIEKEDCIRHFVGINYQII